MSAGSGGNTPISYKANVNRMKTKKWADAKPADYGGDDWGDDDEYDQPPPPISKPTGLRQQGQGLQSGPPSASTPIDNKKTYGELPPLPSAPAASSSRPRVNSFDADDEKRNFSNGTVRQPSPSAQTAPGPATRFSQITGIPSTRVPSGPPALSITTQTLPQQDGSAGPRKASQIVSPLSGSPHPDILLPGPGRTNTGDSGPAFSGPSRINTGESGSVYSQPSDIRTPSSDYQARRDFSPTAVPAPLSTTRASASPAPQSATDTPSSTRFPARKSSLSQSTVPDLSQTAPPTQETPTTKPWVGGRSASPGASARSPSTPTGKALPFIRPADIYRRVEEEKEKERQSMDSSRPSMDSIAGVRTSERSDSPAKPVLKEKTSSDSLGGGRQRTSFERDDASASGRHLTPMLEPVKERKSEYGFEGFNMNEQAAKAAATTESTQPPSESTQLHIEEARRSSVSPKLPDLNRMSGFGMDLFAAPVSEEHEPPLPQASNTHFIPTTSNITSAPAEDTPERQPSLGYRSVVNQAFDRPDDSSVPPTPASQTGSGVRRTDSESTGTTGISPIMSRAPSGAVSDIRGRDGANPSILEVVHEPSSPATAAEETATHSAEPAEHTIAIKPGYRRDIRTPSPGNSPGRTPKTKLVPEGHDAVMGDPSSPDIADDLETLQPPRPIAEREGSFRPSLPGGWTSYATTARSETPHQDDSARASKEVERTQTPSSQISSARQHDDDDYDITPTTTKHSLPQSEPHAAAVAASGGATVGAALGRPGKDSPIDSTASEQPTGVRGNSALPTPNLSMALGGNIYSAAPLDPRLVPKLESVSPEAQLRPAPVQAELSTNSSNTPQAKDTPDLEDAEYSPKPTVPLKQRTMEEVAVNETLTPPMWPQVLPTLSTDTRPQDEENDKLRKEIIKSLSPRPSDAAPRNESLSPEQVDQNRSSEGRFSYLPKEYDNYWASNTEDAEPASLVASTAQKDPEEPVQANTHGANAESPTPPTPPIPPLSARRTSMANESRPPMPTRFSWETSGEDVNLAQRQEIVPEVPAIPPHREQYRPTEAPIISMDEGITPEPSSHKEEAPYSQPATLDYDKELGAQGLGSPVSEASNEDHNGRDTALLAGGAALAGGAVAATAHSHSQPTPSPQHERKLSLAEEKDPRISSYPVSPTPPEEDHPSRSPQAYISGPSTEQPPAPSAAPSSVSPITSPIKTQFSPAARILAFKEIAAIKNPHQRIQTFDETRHRFANMDSGLIDWMSALRAQYPEHAHATGSFNGAAFSAPNGSARSKATGQALPPLQQPYYQQYLNASPTTPGTPVSRPGPSIPSGSQQGFSPAAGKLTSQQVQSKGKELLHTAGVFGGKAGKAGKGLFAKGKNKLRGSGAGDKVD